MHIQVQLSQIDGPTLDFDHNYRLGSAIYSLLKEESEEGADTLHDSHRRSGYVLSEIDRVRGKPKEAWFRMGPGSEAIMHPVSQSYMRTEVISCMKISHQSNLFPYSSSGGSIAIGY